MVAEFTFHLPHCLARGHKGGSRGCLQPKMTGTSETRDCWHEKNMRASEITQAAISFGCRNYLIGLSSRTDLHNTLQWHYPAVDGSKVRSCHGL